MISYSVNRQGIEQQQSFLHREQKDIDQICDDLKLLIKSEQPGTDTYRSLKKCIKLSEEIKDNIHFRNQFLNDTPDKFKEAIAKVDEEINNMEKSARKMGKVR